jgi:sialic acid synthase SpsE
MFLSTPFAMSYVPVLAGLCPALKIASGDNDVLPLLRECAATGLPLILSTGMTDGAAVARARDCIEAVWDARGIDPGLVLLHCVSAYPTPDDQANLGAIRQLATLGRPVGYSDHTLGIEAAVLSVGLGARVIEKHFTKSKTQSEFRDHQLSAEPAELAELVRRVRIANDLLGDGVKRIMPAEEGSSVAARRSICLKVDRPAGHVLSFNDLAWLRPGGGMKPGAEDRLIGHRLGRALPAGHRLSLDDLE